MNILLKSIVIISLLGISNLPAVTPYISIRSQSVDSARDMVGMTDKVNLYDMENMYITAAVTLEGTRSFNPESIAQCLFGPLNCNDCASGCGDNCPSITVSGSRVPNRRPNDWLADYFGLSTTFQSKLFFKPNVSNFLLDFSLYAGLDEFLTGLYVRVHAPIVTTRWDLNFTEQNIDTGLPQLGYDEGYFAPGPVPVNALLTNAESFFSDQDFPTLNGDVAFEPLLFSKFERTRQSKSSLAEIQMVLGYNFFQAEDYHFGFNLRVYAPTGNRPEGVLLFQPIVGNGKHWEVGGGLSTHYTFWQSEDEESSFGVYLDANFTHMFNAHQTRTFDLKGKPNSRYMLAERMGTKVENLFAHANPGLQANSVAPSAQFKSVFIPVANITTLKVTVSSAVQTDMSLLLNYYNCGLSIDVGYNLWARSCEKIKPRCDCINAFQIDSFALKGDSQVFGFDSQSPATAIALSATQTGAVNNNGGATIHSGTNNFVGPNPDDGGINGLRPTQNPGVDNPAFAQTTADASGAEIVDRSVGGLQIQTSLDPVLLTFADIDIEGAQTKGLSNKIFAHMSYTWNDCDDLLPYLGIGAKAEFGPRKHDSKCFTSNSGCAVQATPVINSGCTSCQRCNLSEWGVWIKGGVFFS